MKTFIDNNNLVIKKADKGSTIVVMDREDYIYEAERQLAVKKHYVEIAEPQLPKNCELFNDILQTMKLNKLLTDKEYRFLRTSSNSRERIFYLLPKIHKNLDTWTIPNQIPKGRPIISSVESESYAISKFIDYHLAPYATKHSSYVKNTYDFLNKLGRCRANPDSLLVSLDVESLFTNISTELGIRAVTETFSKDPKPIHKYIIKLLRLSLEGNDFTFNNKHYLQRSGTAMGAKYAPHYADICMAYWETLYWPRSKFQPSLYLRYLDDIFILWEHPRDCFIEFFDTLNNADPDIKLKSNIQENKIEFLDVLIYKGTNFATTGIFDTKVYFKPTDSHALLHKQSFHPNHTFSGLIKSQLIRFGRICNLEKDFDEATSTLFQALYCRNYSRRFLRKIKSQVKEKYFPSNNKVGMSPCLSSNCSICKHVSPNKSISNNGREIKLYTHGNCNTKTAIYLLGCRKCPNTFYVGQTVNVRNRFIAHLSRIRLGSDNKVHLHFQQNNHEINDITINLLETPPSRDSKTLNKLEKQWIKKLNTVELGLNSQEGHDENICPFILKYNPLSKNLFSIAKNWFETHSDLPQLKKNPVTLIKANSRNKNLSQYLVRAKLKTPDNLT